MVTIAMSEESRAPGFVERGPGVDQAGEFAAHQVGIVGKAICRFPVQPAAMLLQVLWQVPVVQRHEGRQALALQPRQQSLVEVESLGVWAALLIHHPRPRDRHAVAVNTETGDQINIRLPAVVVVAGDRARVAIQYLAGGSGKGVPDAGQPTIFGGGALDLVRGGGYPVEKVATRDHAVGWDL